MNYTELEARLAGIAHRTDLTTTIPLFVADANERINRRFGLTLVSPDTTNPTNDVLTNFPLLYIYAAAQSMFEYLNNGQNAQYYNGLWELECDRQNVLNPYTVTDHYTADNPPYIKTPQEVAYVP